MSLTWLPLLQREQYEQYTMAMQRFLPWWQSKFPFHRACFCWAVLERIPGKRLFIQLIDATLIILFSYWRMYIKLGNNVNKQYNYSLYCMQNINNFMFSICTYMYKIFPFSHAPVHKIVSLLQTFFLFLSFPLGFISIYSWFFSLWGICPLIIGKILVCIWLFLWCSWRITAKCVHIYAGLKQTISSGECF